MTGAERGFVLLCSHMGDPQRKVLTAARFRQLSRRVKHGKNPGENRDLEISDLNALGFGLEEAHQILELLTEEQRLDHYLRRAERAGCAPLTLFSGFYPARLENALSEDTPPVLWCKGDASLLQRPKIALVGSRDILPENAEFARQAGIQAAAQEFTLVSGNARGADRIAQDACLASGGSVISVVADSLTDHSPAPNQLLLSEDSFDLDFTRIRALRRNRLIHALGAATLVAQCGFEKGGTWDGTARNLRSGWSPVYCFDDGSLGTDALEQMGAELIRNEQLRDLPSLIQQPYSLWDI